jgi:NitT/TauT family transport system ATP-binding protein
MKRIHLHPTLSGLRRAFLALLVPLACVDAARAQALEKTELKFGFIKLTDCAPLVIAKEKGFFRDEGLSVEVVAQPNWKTLLDNVISGATDGAHMLSGQPIAATIGIGTQAHVVTAFTMDLNGNAITVSNAVWEAMQLADESLDTPTPPHPITAAALRPVVDDHIAQGKKLQMAMVFPVSTHNYELRYWLAASGIDPDRDIEILILPPPDMGDALAEGLIDGYCAGEPWNSFGVLKRGGHLATIKAAIWKSSPEKVLGVNARWAEANPDALAALLAVLYKASVWCGKPENREELARLLAQPAYVGRDADLLMPALTGEMAIGGGIVKSIADFFVPNAKAATFPWKSHALWFYTQMVRWGQISDSAERRRIAAGTYRPDIYRAALRSLGIAMPSASSKVEGALAVATPVGSSGALTLGPDGFFDGRIFDPHALDAYVGAQANA